MNKIEKAYGSGSFSLGPISISLKPGRITVVIGKNGSGKSTLLSIIAGRLLQTKGDITYPYLSQAQNWSEIKAKIAYLASASLPSPYEIRETLEYVAATNEKLGDLNRKFVDDYLSRYDLERYASYRWPQLSEGYRMRLNLVRALLASPNLLVLDEPLAHLDIQARANFLFELTELSRTFSNPMCIVLSTHHLDEAELIADDVIILANGKCLFFGDKVQLRRLTSGSVFHVLGGITPEAFSRFSNMPGLQKANRVLGGVALHFRDVVTIEQLIEQLQPIGMQEISSISDLSGSSRVILDQGESDEN